MHTVVRTYSGKGAVEIIGFIAANKPAIDALMNSVKGFVSYTLVTTPDGGFSVTLAEDAAASDAITAKAREWVAANAAHFGAAAPAITAGDVAMHIA